MIALSTHLGAEVSKDMIQLVEKTIMPLANSCTDEQKTGLVRSLTCCLLYLGQRPGEERRLLHLHDIVHWCIQEGVFEGELGGDMLEALAFTAQRYASTSFLQTIVTIIQLDAK
jgi:hypothetical protein